MIRMGAIGVYKYYGFLGVIIPNAMFTKEGVGVEGRNGEGRLG